MADDFSASIEDYLVGLAASLQHAQRQLSDLTVPGDNARPTVSYQLPKLDFQLKMSLELSEESAGSAGSGTGVALRGRLLRAGGSRSESAEAASVISGSFVAVPLSGGKPPPVMNTDLHRLHQNSLRITVKLTTATGEPLSGVPVQFNTDRGLAESLNPGLPRIDTNPRFALVQTNANGEAVNQIDAGPEEPGTRIPVIIDALGRTTTVVFRVEAPPSMESSTDDEVGGDDE